MNEEGIWLYTRFDTRMTKGGAVEGPGVVVDLGGADSAYGKVLVCDVFFGHRAACATFLVS